jgi:hypothetical protein
MKRVIVCLIIAGLLTGLIGRVPVARATVANVTPPYYMKSAINHGYYKLYFVIASYTSGVVAGADSGPSTSYHAYYADGVVIGWVGAVIGVSTSGPVIGLELMFSSLDMTAYINDGVPHLVSWVAGTMNWYGVDYSWAAGSFWTIASSGGAYNSWGSAAAFGYHSQWPEPLTVTIDSGPTAVDLVNGGTWHATATGGTTPYTYYWDWMPLGGSYHYNTPFDPVGPTGTDTYSHTWPTAGIYVLECMVQDADGTWADATYQVSAASVIGSYHALFGRYGDKGQYLNVQVDDAAGNPVTISSTADTKFGLYLADGAFAWENADSEAAQLVTYTWRWVMSYTITPPGLALPPPADFWIETSIHLAVPNIDLQVTHHFTSLSETLDPWYGPEGNPQVPETPPTETSTLPDWLQPVYDMFVRLLRFLFVPSASDFSAQLASGWILITSPVPSITPQYTIPFPNPSHLLAPTGDSVNIDFSVVQGYAGYSIMHTIVQVLMYAILVFIVIGIIT